MDSYRRREGEAGRGHGRECPDEYCDEERDRQPGRQHEELVEPVGVDPNQRQRDNVEDDVADAVCKPTS